MQTETAVSAAFKRAGYHAGIDTVYTTIAALIRTADGNQIVARRLLVAAASQDLELRNAVYDLAIASVMRDMRGELLGGGQSLYADNGSPNSAPVQQPHEGDDARGFPPNTAKRDVPSSPSPNERAGGPEFAAKDGRLGSASPRSPNDGREASTAVPQGQSDDAPRPSPLIGHNSKPPRGAAAIASVQNTVAKSLFDTVKIRGEAIGDLTIGEARKAVRDNTRESLILGYLIEKAGQPADQSDPLRKLVKVSDVREAIRRAEQGK